MNRVARSKRAPRRAAGFTLIEMLVAIALLAIVAVLSYRGLDEIIRARESLTANMSNERALSQLFAQLDVDLRNAARDDEVGQPPVRVGGGVLQVVREMRIAGAPRLQVVRYRDIDHRIVRQASPAIATVGDLRKGLNAKPNDQWSSVDLVGGVEDFGSQAWVPDHGFTSDMNVARDQLDADVKAPAVPQAGNGPLPRSVTGVAIDVRLHGDPAPVRRVLLVGE
ncbi:PulJ/GspJ family protein [Pararobbsia silviterrae]|uniref:Prepilin-type N-terminal cleavage/methylation domain-containing protein n=1 Tax=Pararobbsia silviterrae TaxID=1792498 RepID=A0A494Y812_9BURK|nr:prepilin-type N-terminal cleavage/methylation domain-containing protein [Pararobbsia silviterrae]RKP58516.1 prepilin-type N-terminal cleavage/methylation domain-containing protein [Pararobbsia silviterrae]